VTSSLATLDASCGCAIGAFPMGCYWNRCFPTKAVRGWLATDDEGRAGIVTEYFRRAGAFAPATAALCTPPATAGDPLYAVWATRLAADDDR